jgi:hypothetical protein
VTLIVGLPNDLAFGTPAEQRRAQRRTDDALLVLARGHALLPGELGAASSIDGQAAATDKQIVDAVRAAGEDPEHTLTFSVLASRARRFIANSAPLPGFELGRRLILDYTVRLEVRRAGHPDVIGTVDTVVSGFPNEGEVGPRGESLGLQKAIEEALAKAVRSFAPGLIPRGGGGVPDLPAIAEVPASVTGDAHARLVAVQELYPELSLEQMQVLTTSEVPFLVLRPGALAPMGIAAGDLLVAPFGQALRSRAAIARLLARGGPVKLVVERAGQRYLLGGGALAEAGPAGSAVR